ncbi:MAG: succinylglutamate desuccinylase/aspartoacylase family protein [Sandaracinus sp.]|nr:succinylglutamate desuccinylase/aspartoacylase family protein [Sandaracinus sp.]
MSDWIEAHERGEFTPVERLSPSDLAPGLHHLGIHVVEDGAARPVHVPAIVARGVRPGPTVGITAAVHGNELNGIATIHRLFRRIDPNELSGTVVGATIVNVPGFIRHDRLYPDAQDLNRVMPGKADGNEASVYAHRLSTRLFAAFDVLLDLHTASFGRVNTLYVRADMRDAATAKLARAIGAEIIVHNAGGDGTVRSSVASRGIPAITVEIGDPQVIDRDKVRLTRVGIRDVIEELGMLPPDGERAVHGAIECHKSYWLYTDTGGLLDVTARLGAQVKEGDVLATLSDPWGRRLRTYRAPEEGYVVGKATNPVVRTGGRIVHLGIEGAPP